MNTTYTTLEPNEEPTSPTPPPRHLVRRSALLTTLLYSPFIISRVMMDYPNPPPATLTDYMELLFIPESLAVVIGSFLIWRVFPHSYFPTPLEVCCRNSTLVRG